MRPVAHFCAALFWLLAFTADARAQIVQAQNVKLEVPSGWAALPAASSRSMRLRSPDGKVDVTVFAHPSEATLNSDLAELAARFLKAEFTAQERFAKDNGLTVVHHTSEVTAEGGRWHARSATGFSSGLEVRGLTLFERGQAVSFGSESKHAAQSELEAAIQLMMGRVRQ